VFLEKYQTMLRMLVIPADWAPRRPQLRRE
jgi:hypothetical protein